MSNGSDILLNVGVVISEIKDMDSVSSALTKSFESALSKAAKNVNFSFNTSVKTEENQVRSVLDKLLGEKFNDVSKYGALTCELLNKLIHSTETRASKQEKQDNKQKEYDKKYYAWAKEHGQKNIFAKAGSFLTQIGVIAGILNEKDIKKGLKAGSITAERYNYRVRDKDGNLTDKIEKNIPAIAIDIFGWIKAIFNVSKKIYEVMKRNYEKIHQEVNLFQQMLETTEKEVDVSNFLTRAESMGHLSLVNSLATHSDESFDKVLSIGRDFYKEDKTLQYGKYKNVSGTEFEGAEVKYRTDSENIISLVQSVLKGVAHMKTNDGKFTEVKLTEEQRKERLKYLTESGISMADMLNFDEYYKKKYNGIYGNEQRMISPYNISGQETLMELERNTALNKFGNEAINNYDKKRAYEKNRLLNTINTNFIDNGANNLKVLNDIFAKEIDIRKQFLDKMNSILEGKLATLYVDYAKSYLDSRISAFLGNDKKNLIEFKDTITKIQENDENGIPKNSFAKEVIKNPLILEDITKLKEYYKEMFKKSNSAKLNIKFLTQDYVNDIAKKYGYSLTSPEELDVINTLVRIYEKSSPEIKKEIYSFIGNAKLESESKNFNSKTTYK